MSSMVIVCEGCGARFRINPALFQNAKGARIRCRKCGGHIEVRHPEASPVSPAPEVRGAVRYEPAPTAVPAIREAVPKEGSVTAPVFSTEIPFPHAPDAAPAGEPERDSSREEHAAEIVPLKRRLRASSCLRHPASRRHQALRDRHPQDPGSRRPTLRPAVLPGRAPPLFPEPSPTPAIRNRLRTHRPNRGFGRGESFGNDKVFLRSADQSIGQVAGFRRKRAPSPAATENNMPRRKRIGENSVEVRSPLRMEPPARSLRGPSRMWTRESTQGKGSRRARLPRTATSSSRHERFSGIANRSHVIRGKRLDIKKVHGNRHFPVDTVNAIF